jgi:hypothetical protein
MSLEGTIHGGFLSQKAFMQLINMKLRASSPARKTLAHGGGSVDPSASNNRQ